MRRALLVPIAVAALVGCGAEVTQGGGKGTGGKDMGAGGASTGGITGSGGEGLGGAGGNMSLGGMIGTGGNGAAGSGVGGAGDDATQIKQDLEAAAKWLLPCGADQSYSLLVCQNPPSNGTPPKTGNCRAPSATVPYLTAGTINLDKTITLRGTAGKTYTVTARIQGIVEPKHYMNGIATGTGAATCAGAPALATNCGWYVGGEPNQSGNYNVYMMWVSAPAPNPSTGLQGQYFFLNNINKTEAHFSYPIDYTVTFQVNGGAMVRFLADDSNCSAIKNCAVGSIDTVPGGGGVCNPITLPNMVTTSAGAVAQPYSGQFIVLSVLDVK